MKEMAKKPLANEELAEFREKTIAYHQAGLNGAQAVLQTLMDYHSFPNMPQLVEMTGTWKGGVGGTTCSAYAAATLAIGMLKESQSERLQQFDTWFKENYRSISCPTITATVGGRPSPEQKAFCDLISAQTAEYVYKLTNIKE